MGLNCMLTVTSEDDERERVAKNPLQNRSQNLEHTPEEEKDSTVARLIKFEALLNCKESLHYT